MEDYVSSEREVVPVHFSHLSLRIIFPPLPFEFVSTTLMGSQLQIINILCTKTEEIVEVGTMTIFINATSATTIPNSSTILHFPSLSKRLIHHPLWCNVKHNSKLIQNTFKAQDMPDCKYVKTNNFYAFSLLNTPLYVLILSFLVLWTMGNSTMA